MLLITDDEIMRKSLALTGLLAGLAAAPDINAQAVRNDDRRPSLAMTLHRLGSALRMTMQETWALVCSSGSAGM